MSEMTLTNTLKSVFTTLPLSFGLYVNKFIHLHVSNFCDIQNVGLHFSVLAGCVVTYFQKSEYFRQAVDFVPKICRIIIRITEICMFCFSVQTRMIVPTR